MRLLKLFRETFILILALTFQAGAQIVPTNGLIAYYPLDGNGTDQSGNGNNGVATSVLPGTNRFGTIGSACLFNTTGAVITIPSLASANLTALSISLWAQIQAVNPTYGAVLVEKWRGYSYSLEDYTIGVTPDLRVNFGNGRHGANYNALPNHCSVYSTNAIALGVWYHIVATVDSAGNCSLWINGTLSAQDNILPLLPPASEPVGSDAFLSLNT